MANYNVALGEGVLQAKLNKAIEAGRASAVSVIERIQNEIPDDKIVRTDRLVFADRRRAHGSRRGKQGRQSGRSRIVGTLHRNALGQLAARADMPLAFASTLQGQGDWGRELLADNFNRIFAHVTSQRVLTRAVKGEIRGVLSDSYRRMDSRPDHREFCPGVPEGRCDPCRGRRRRPPAVDPRAAPDGLQVDHRCLRVRDLRRNL